MQAQIQIQRNFLHAQRPTPTVEAWTALAVIGRASLSMSDMTNVTRQNVCQHIRLRTMRMPGARHMRDRSCQVWRSCTPDRDIPDIS